MQRFLAQLLASSARPVASPGKPRLTRGASFAPRLLCLAPLALGLLATPAFADEITGGAALASLADDEGPVEVKARLDYVYSAASAAIKREDAGLTGSSASPGSLPVVRDLLYNHNRHTLLPSLALEVLDVARLRLALPIVLNDTRVYKFDQRDKPCVFTGSNATCINTTNSTTFRDGLLPTGGATGGMGYDADDPTNGFAMDSETVFRGVDRSGLDQLWVGLEIIAMNQDKDDTKPTWTIGVEGRFSIGKIMKFDRLNPEKEDGVSPGYHEVFLYTAVKRRTSWAEPFVSFYWDAPFALRGDDPDERDSSLFWDVGFGQEHKLPQQVGGTTFGFRAIPWENKKQKQELWIDILGRVDAHFEGRGYSEMWEVFSYAGDPTTGGPLVLDADPVTPGEQSIAYPGTTDIENYMTFAGTIGIGGQIGERAKFSAGFQLAHDQRHIISFTDAGNELPACANGITGNCESPNDDVITSGTTEVNPLHERIIDLVGRRYIVDESTTYSFLVNAVLMF